MFCYCCCCSCPYPQNNYFRKKKKRTQHVPRPPGHDASTPQGEPRTGKQRTDWRTSLRDSSKNGSKSGLKYTFRSLTADLNISVLCINNRMPRYQCARACMNERVCSFGPNCFLRFRHHKRQDDDKWQLHHAHTMPTLAVARCSVDIDSALSRYPAVFSCELLLIVCCRKISLKTEQNGYF